MADPNEVDKLVGVVEVVPATEEVISEEESFTAKSALEAIENAWINEKFAPEILPHRSDLVDCMLEQILHMEANIKRLEKCDIRITIHTMELNRIRFVISCYLRTRLEKIENHVLHILSQDAEAEFASLYLTPGERKFAQEYLINLENLFRTLALRHMPANFQKFEVEKFSIKPNLYSHVFIRAKKNLSGIMIPGTMDDEVDFEAGSQHIIQYNAVAELLKLGDVQLI